MNTEASFHTLFTPVIICQSKFVSEHLFLYRYILYLKGLASKNIFLISSVFPEGKYRVCVIGCHIKLFKGF